MRNTIRWALLLLIAGACSSPETRSALDMLDGSWDAQWDTNPAAFPDVSDVSIFTMNGSFTFRDDQVTVKAQGFPGCIFSTDTLSHTLSWQLKNDTLSLINEGDIYGMTYKVLVINEKQIKLQLMDDIFVTLSR